MLKVLITEHIYNDQDFFFVHLVDLKLCSKKEFNSTYLSKLDDEITKGFDEFYGAINFTNEE